MQRASSSDSLVVNFTDYEAQRAEERINLLREQMFYSFEEICQFFKDYEVVYEKDSDRVALLLQYLPVFLREKVNEFINLIRLEDDDDGYLYQKVRVFLMALPIQNPILAVIIEPDSHSEAHVPIAKRVNRKRARVYYSDSADTEKVSSSEGSSSDSNDSDTSSLVYQRHPYEYKLNK